jgi:hypothetical protein
MQIQWRGHTLRVTEPTAGDYWAWLMALRDALIDDEYIGVISWIADHVHDAALIVPEPIESIEDHPVRLGERILAECEIGVRAMEVMHRVADVDRAKMRFACECQRCRRKADYDEGCIYVAANISAIEQRVSHVSAELLSSMWDRPYSLYRLAETARYCDALKDVPRHDVAGTKGKTPAQQLASFRQRLKGKR